MITLTHHAAGSVLAVSGDPLPAADADGDRRSRALVRGLLLRVRGGQRRVPDGERDLPARDPRNGDRVLLAVGTGLGGLLAPGTLREADRVQQLRGTSLIGSLIAAAWLLVAGGQSRDVVAVDAEQLAPWRRSPSRCSATGQDEGDETGDEGAGHEEPTHHERREVGGYPVRAGAHWSPRYSFHGVDDPLEGQIAAIERAAADADRPLSERELLTRTSSRHWGPGVARRAVRRAVDDGVIERRNGVYVGKRVSRRPV